MRGGGFGDCHGAADTACSIWRLLSLMHFIKRNSPKGVLLFMCYKSLFVHNKMLMNLK